MRSPLSHSLSLSLNLAQCAESGRPHGQRARLVAELTPVPRFGAPVLHGADRGPRGQVPGQPPGKFGLRESRGESRRQGRRQRGSVWYGQQHAGRARQATLVRVHRRQVQGLRPRVQVVPQEIRICPCCTFFKPSVFRKGITKGSGAGVLSFVFVRVSQSPKSCICISHLDISGVLDLPT